MNNSKRNKILFGVVVALAFFLSMGATYAYFSLVVKGNNSANNTVVTSGSLEITYEETNTITASNVIPG